MKSSKTIIIFLALSILVLQASCFSLSDVASLQLRPRPLMNAYASSTGEVTIFKDLDGYFIYTDLTYTKNTGQVGNDTVKMMLGLTNNNVLLIDSCLNFNQYPCDYYHCTKSSADVETVNYTNFVASTIKASARTYLDYAYWDVEEKALLATSCLTSSSGYIGSGRYGILGLGTQGSSQSNFLKTRQFSISFNSDLQSGTLKFISPDQKSAPSSGNGLTASTNWIIPSKGFIQVGGYSISFHGGLAFDINADALGLPSDMFRQAVQAIVSGLWIKGVSCTNDTYQPTCNYTGYIRDLPQVVVCTSQTSYVDFVIPPEIYVKNAKSKDDYVYSITLNWKALDPSASGESYVTSGFKNNIIMDARTMSFLNIVFDATTGSNFVRISEKHDQPPNPPHKWWIYVILVIVVLAIIGGFFAFIKKRMANNRRGVAPVAQTTQEPLVVADNSVVSGYNYQQNMYPGAGVVPAQGNNYYQQQQPQGMMYAPPNPPSDGYPNNGYGQYAKPQ